MFCHLRKHNTKVGAWPTQPIPILDLEDKDI